MLYKICETCVNVRRFLRCVINYIFKPTLQPLLTFYIPVVCHRPLQFGLLDQRYSKHF